MSVRQCYDCDRRYDGDRARCECGEPLWFAETPLERWPEESNREGRSAGGPTGNPGGVWRYTPSLPAARPSADLGAGTTPLVRARRLDDYAGCRVLLKDEGQNPTGSFKDRGSAVGCAVAAETGIERVGTVSHGNMARSVAAHAAATGLDCVVLVPDDIADARLSAIGRYDPRILRVRGDYGRLYHDALAIGRDHDIAFLNSDVPLRVAGQKTLAFELFESASDLDAIVLPVSSGGNASAVWKGLRELRAGGLIDALPRLYLVQSAACDPIAAAFRDGSDRVEPAAATDETVAYSIANPDPPSGTRALTAARETGGTVHSASDEAIREARDALAREAGVRAEASSATVLAGARRLADEGELTAEDRVACVVTGRGYGGGGLPESERVDRAELTTALAERSR